MGTYAQKLKDLIATNEVENEDLILQFANEAETDSDKEKAIERFFANSSSSNPFDEKLSYYDLLAHYEDIQNESADC